MSNLVFLFKDEDSMNEIEVSIILSRQVSFFNPITLCAHCNASMSPNIDKINSQIATMKSITKTCTFGQ